jgi:hypothetical protein
VGLVKLLGGEVKLTTSPEEFGMGIRLAALDNPALRVPVAAGAEPAVPAPTAPRAGADAPDTVPLLAATAIGEGVVQQTETIAPQPLLLTDPPDEANPAPTPAEVNAAGILDGVSALRVRDFRFLAAAQTAREQNLDTQRTRLEQRLETTYDRLQANGSAMDRIDARLDRARLEQDLETVARAIRRLRLERVFARPSVAPEPVPVETQVSAAPESQAMAASGTPTLNLLA